MRSMSRRYAEAMGALEKTDRIDAAMIARFAQPKTCDQRHCRARCSNASKPLWQGSGRSPTISPCRSNAGSSLLDNAEMLASINEVIALLKRQSRTLEGEIGSMIDDDPMWAHLADTFPYDQGRGRSYVAWLMADLPEIGTYSNKAIAKLVRCRSDCQTTAARDGASGRFAADRRRALDPVLVAATARVTTKASASSARGW